METYDSFTAAIISTVMIHVIILMYTLAPYANAVVLTLTRIQACEVTILSGHNLYFYVTVIIIISLLSLLLSLFLLLVLVLSFL